MANSHSSSPSSAVTVTPRSHLRQPQRVPRRDPVGNPSEQIGITWCVSIVVASSTTTGRQCGSSIAPRNRISPSFSPSHVLGLFIHGRFCFGAATRRNMRSPGRKAWVSCLKLEQAHFSGRQICVAPSALAVIECSTQPLRAGLRLCRAFGALPDDNRPQNSHCYCGHQTSSRKMCSGDLIGHADR